MKKSRINFVVDTFGYIIFLLLGSTGIIMHYMLPPGSGEHFNVWGLGRHDWGNIHFWVSIAFFGILALHLILHWRWIWHLIIGKNRETKNNRALLGLAGAIGLLLIALAPVLSPVQVNPGGGGEEHEEHTEGGVFIKGSFSLKQVEQLSGVPADYLIKELQLPDDVSKNERLGELKNQYSFSMETVRQLVEEYDKKE